MNRSERLQQLSRDHIETVTRLRDFAGQMIDPSLDALQSPEIVDGTIRMFLNGILNFPQFIHFRGKRLSDYDKRFRNNIGNSLYRYGLHDFGMWVHEKWFKEKDAREATRTRVLQRNMEHFVESWFGGEETRPEPSWEELQKTHEAVMNGTDQEVYGLYASLFNGFQTSAIELFLEDTAPPEQSLRSYLLQ